jgi:hypothetical protein
LTFTAAPQGQQITIPSLGAIRQIIERANIIPGTYVLSWTGTAGGRVYNEGASAPSYNLGNSLTFVLDGTANVVVDMAAGGSSATVGNVQLERNLQPTPFEQRPIGVELMLCQRYYERFQLDNAAITRTIGPGGWDSATSFSLSLMFKTLKRTTPTMSSSNSGFQVLYHGLAWYTGTTTTFTEPGVYGVRANIASSGSAVQGQAGIAVLANTSAFMAADSEL